MRKKEKKNNIVNAIAFDLVGVLIYEKNIKLSNTEQILERKFGSININDDYYRYANNKTGLSRLEINKAAFNIIKKLYALKDPLLFTKIPPLKFALATNHLSIINKWLYKSGFVKNFDQIIISANVKTEKPKKKFFNLISLKLNERPENILFIDDNILNVNAAKKYHFQTLWLKKNMSLSQEILKILKRKRRL